MARVIIEVEDLTMAYQDKPVLWDNDVDIIENSRTAIIGPNGAGKSTFLKGILGLLPSLSGYVKFMGRPLEEVREKVAYIPQSKSVNWDFPTTALDVVLMGRYVHLGWIKRPTKKDYRIAEEALERMGMGEYRDRQISQLSGGQRQRVFLARTIAQEAEIYIMDEPLAGVDMTTEKVIIDFLHEAQAEGKTSVVVHHDLNTLADYFDHLVILNKRVIAQGLMEDVLLQENLELANIRGFQVAY
ncbi:MAG: ABC transporter ATP-binding protein [Bacillota bacterium]|nr:ABC transporter ATP-binding protein [Bacillota bacterium]